MSTRLSPFWWRVGGSGLIWRQRSIGGFPELAGELSMPREVAEPCRGSHEEVAADAASSRFAGRACVPLCRLFHAADISYLPRAAGRFHRQGRRAHDHWLPGGQWSRRRLASQSRAPLLLPRALVAGQARGCAFGSDRRAPGRSRGTAFDRDRRHAAQALGTAGMGSRLASRADRRDTPTVCVGQQLGGGRDRRAAVVPAPARGAAGAVQAAGQARGQQTRARRAADSADRQALSTAAH